MSFWLLVVIFTRLANFLVVKINSTSTLLGSRRAASSRWLGWICQTRTRTSAGQCFHGYFRLSTNQQSSLTMFWGWWDHTFYVYQLCTWLCMCRDARRTTSYDHVRCRTTLYVPAHTQPRTQLVDVKCVVPPAAEHSQAALLTPESIGGSCHCQAEVIVRVWHIYPSHLDDAARREPRIIEGEYVDFDDDKICQNV